MSLISARDLTVRLGRTAILEHVDLAVEAGEIVTIIGPNGSGKSTLLKAMIGAVPLAGGRVLRAPGLRIGYVPQRLHVDPSLPMTVARFLSLPQRAAAPAVAEALAKAGAGRLAAHQLIHLSGGQLQRVLLARALLGHPQLLLLDEPTQGLDQQSSARFYAAIEDARANLNCGVLLVSHDLHVVMDASDRVVCLDTRIRCEGSPEEVSRDPGYRALVGSGTRGALALCHHDHDYPEQRIPVPHHDHS